VLLGWEVILSRKQIKMSVTWKNFGTKLFQSLSQEHVLNGIAWERIHCISDISLTKISHTNGKYHICEACMGDKEYFCVPDFFQTLKQYQQQPVFFIF
jgi:hypothetical protein